ncbi:MAG TPA: hypothetical protein VFH68_01220 [Polyangia bacterium]|jgi:hypothetical protein|nr:hypothetical protein [Polyangia bacterium]
MKNQISLHLSIFSFITLATAATSAWAAPVSDGESPTTVATGPAAPAPAAADPNIDRGFIQPTAMTQPARSLTYNNYELVLHGLTYGITDHLQTSVTVMAPLVRDMPFLGVAAVKWQFLSTRRFHLALQGSATMIHYFRDDSAAPDGSSSSGDGAHAVGAGAFASYCLRDDCSSLASLNATYQLGFAGRGSGTTQAIIYGGSIVHRVSPHVKLLGEVTSMAATTVTDSNFDNVPGALVSYGVRLHTANIAGDVGFMKPISGEGEDPFLLGLPFINVSYRW